MGTFPSLRINSSNGVRYGRGYRAQSNTCQELSAVVLPGVHVFSFAK
jgi:hypothetical protein